MSRLLRSAPVIVSLLALAVMVTGCPKRPGTAISSAPAPSGSAGTSQSSSAMVPAAAASPSRGSALAPPRPSEFSASSGLKEIHFDFDKYAIRPDDAKILDANAAWLKSRPEDLVLIEGHCDERGTSEYNLALGERRASATREYLTSAGVSAGRITTVTYGKERPQCAEHSEECWAQNRRAHFLVKP